MTLLKKCALFLGVILIVQICLFTGFSSLVFKVKKEAQEANYSRDLVTHTIQSCGTLYDCVDSVMLWTISRKDEAKTRYLEIVTEAPNEMVKSLKDISLSDGDSNQVKDLDMRITMCLDAVERAFKIADTGLAKFVLFRQIFLNELEPQISDIRMLERQILKSHRNRALSFQEKEAEFVDLARFSLTAIFAANCIALVALVLGFSQGIVRRIAVIGDNINRFWKGKPLNRPLAGKDEISRLDASFHDMSRALSDARDKDGAVMKNLPVGILVCDEGGAIESANPQSTKLLCCTEEELLGKNIRTLIVDPDFSFALLEKTELPRIWRLTMQAKSFPAELSISKFQYSNELRYLIGIMDVTAREQVEQLKQEFVSVVSHDLKSPLTSMQINAAVISGESKNHALSDRSSRALLNIERDCQRLLRLTQDLLDIAKLESGNVTLEKERQSLASILEQSLDVVDPLATHKGIRLEWTGTDVEITCDRDRIVQVLVNLLSNAIKFTESGGLVMISAEQDDAYVRVDVIDSGRGIEKDQQQFIFDRFKQTSTADAKGGTGLGLAICKLLVEAHNGAIGVESEQGKGSTFWIRLPNR